MIDQEIEIRRLHIEDEQWERTSSSWKALKPFKNFNRFDETDESIEQYCGRVKNIIDVPLEVADQWLYCHYYNGHTVDNYGWIDYFNAEFSCCTLFTSEAIEMRVISPYSSYVNSRTNGKPFDDFRCIQEDKEHWVRERTWRVPPIAVDVKSFGQPPHYADFSGELQLVEGYSRLGYLLSMNRVGERLAKQHKIFVLRNVKNA